MRDTALGSALRRLEAVVGVLEAASAHVVESRRTGVDRDAEVAMLANDRARLAEELDVASARAARLESANRDVARRLDTAIDTIRDVLSKDGP